MIRKHSIRSAALAAFTLVATLVGAAPALAANPDFDAVSWTPLLCDTPNLTVPAAPASVNLVGDTTYPPTYYAYDANYLYFRYRVDGNPASGGGFDSYSWTALMQTPSGNPFQYQYQLSLDGKGGSDSLQIWANTVASDINFNPNFHDDSEIQLFTQPYDQLGGAVGNTTPLARSYATGDGSSFAGDPDYFVEFAFPVSVLISEGVITDSNELGEALFFPATSTSASTYNKGYLNCPFLPQTQLGISKTVEPAAVPANATSPVAYTITVTNTSAYPAKGVVIEDIALPAYMSNVTADVSTDPDVTWTVESVNPLLVKVAAVKAGRTVTVTLSADAAPPCGPDFENVATARATNVKASSGSVTLVTHAPELCDGADNDCNGQTDDGGNALCDDADACNGLETCGGMAGCQAGTAPDCNDGDVCTTDACDSQAGCVHPPAADGTACDDGDACTLSDGCQAGDCVGANPVVCSASDQCHTAGTCDPATGTCSNPAAADGTACNDSDACTQSDTCQSGGCVGADPVVCSASDQCHTAGTCDPATGTCSNPAAADGAACNDSDACTQSDTCQSGGCVGADPVVCSASDQCHTAGTCDPATGICSDPMVADGTACSDGDACTENDICLDGSCEPGTIAPSCVPPVEMCGNCLDDDGDGLVDAEDPDCCDQTQALGLKRFSLRLASGKVKSQRLRLKMRAAFLPNEFDPMSQDTSLQIADADGQVFCHTIEAKNWKHPRRRIYRFKDKTETFAGGLRRGKFVMKKKGGIAFATAGKNMHLSTAGGEMVVTLRVGNQCAQTEMSLRTNRKGFVFP